ncbi:aminodeoxychorismate synthase component I [Actinoplanes sp. RD1]|uniref:aminodeoxychorismate synthase component I n=1 Tax=Actinoplanes sp. RD1 TaxID=3064538 RepID=UPI002740D8B9|nr:aminodeoxychorismate synthase component I [Actinoplanes sp. RD1]
MRTLIVDNYDSFTWNLAHQLAEVNGSEPVVVRNDDPGWHAGLLDGFDNVVISPGPGRPGRERDFGISREVILDGRLPTLGVCLGHQGIGELLGGVVDLAPEPRHGRRSPVRHDGSGLFAGIPSPFEVVRYHSLAVTELPAELIPVAWSDDGVLMGVRHRDRPLWGVQFHPESIRTEYGHQLLANFRDLTPRRVAAPPIQHEIVNKSGAATIRSERIAVDVDAEAVFDTLFRGGDHPFWLDSNAGPGVSIMGDASGPLSRVARADVAAGTVTVAGAGRSETVTSGFFDWLDADLRAHRAEPDAPLPFDFALGWVGYLGYELKAECGARPGHRSPHPDAVLVFADRAVVVDHRDGAVHLLTLDHPGAGDWLADTGTRLRALADARTRQRALADTGTRPRALAARPADAVPRRDITLRHDRDTYLGLIKECQAAIHEGETYEICLTNMLTVAGAVPPWAAYRALRRVSPAPFGAYLGFGDVAVLSASPERFLRVDAAGRAESKPIKGTRPRGATPEADDALRHDLATSEKDQAENLMIVDLVRNDLGRVGRPGTVRVPRLFDVESFATVHQLVSTVVTELRPGASAVDCVRAAFPGGSMTGAPKLRTMEIIDRLEGGPRGVYSGALGYFSLTGAADLSMVIRTLVVAGDRATYGVGGAIIALSDPAAEFEETAVKATGLLRLLRTDFPGRVTRPPADPPAGVTAPPADLPAGVAAPPVDPPAGVTAPPADPPAAVTAPPVDPPAGVTTPPAGSGGTPQPAPR